MLLSRPLQQSLVLQAYERRKERREKGRVGRERGRKGRRTEGGRKEGRKEERKEQRKQKEREGNYTSTGKCTISHSLVITKSNCLKHGRVIWNHLLISKQA